MDVIPVAEKRRELGRTITDEEDAAYFEIRTLDAEPEDASTEAAVQDQTATDSTAPPDDTHMQAQQSAAINAPFC